MPESILTLWLNYRHCLIEPVLNNPGILESDLQKNCKMCGSNFYRVMATLEKYGVITRTRMAKNHVFVFPTAEFLFLTKTGTEKLVFILMEIPNLDNLIADDIKRFLDGEHTKQDKKAGKHTAQ